MNSLSTSILFIHVYLIVIVHQSLASIEGAAKKCDSSFPPGSSFFADSKFGTSSSSSSSSYQCPASANHGDSSSIAKNYDTTSVKKSNFPTNFLFGISSSSYQYEGAANEGGRSPSIWDTFTEKYPGRIKDRSNGAVAVDSYHRFKEDVDIMKDIGFNAYRFSISWPRILPGGNITGGVNKEGIRYYNNLINELLSNALASILFLYARFPSSNFRSILKILKLKGIVYYG